MRELTPRRFVACCLGVLVVLGCGRGPTTAAPPRHAVPTLQLGSQAAAEPVASPLSWTVAAPCLGDSISLSWLPGSRLLVADEAQFLSYLPRERKLSWRQAVPEGMEFVGARGNMLFLSGLQQEDERNYQVRSAENGEPVATYTALGGWLSPGGRVMAVLDAELDKEPTLTFYRLSDAKPLQRFNLNAQQVIFSDDEKLAAIVNEEGRLLAVEVAWPGKEGGHLRELAAGADEYPPLTFSDGLLRWQNQGSFIRDFERNVTVQLQDSCGVGSGLAYDRRAGVIAASGGDTLCLADARSGKLLYESQRDDSWLQHSWKVLGMTGDGRGVFVEAAANVNLWDVERRDGVELETDVTSPQWSVILATVHGDLLWVSDVAGASSHEVTFVEPGLRLRRQRLPVAYNNILQVLSTGQLLVRFDHQDEQGDSELFLIDPDFVGFRSISRIDRYTTVEVGERHVALVSNGAVEVLALVGRPERAVLGSRCSD